MALDVQPATLGALVNPVSLGPEARKRASLLCQHVARMSAFTLACDLAGVPYTTACTWRNRCPEFQQMLADAEERRTQLLEAEAWRRGIGGSDLMLIFMLKAARPAQYRENWKVELTGPDGAALELSDPQRAARIAALMVAMRDKRQAASDASVIVDGEYRDIPAPRDDCEDLL